MDRPLTRSQIAAGSAPRKAASPSKKDSTPVRKANSPPKKGTSPPKKTSSPKKGGQVFFSESVTQTLNGESPVQVKTNGAQGKFKEPIPNTLSQHKDQDNEKLLGKRQRKSHLLKDL